jgi:hypothetical protein
VLEVRNALEGREFVLDGARYRTLYYLVQFES